MVVVTRCQRKRLPPLPSEVWTLVASHLDRRGRCAIRRADHELRTAIRATVPDGPRHCMFTVVCRTLGVRERVVCELEWLPHRKGRWRFQCASIATRVKYHCSLPPVFWSDERPRSYRLRRRNARTHPPPSPPVSLAREPTLLVHPTHRDGDVQLTVGHGGWSHSLTALGALTRYLNS